jgi:hypothetical protein
LNSALNAGSLEFGGALRRDRPAPTQFGSERRGVWAQASYNIGARPRCALCAPPLRCRHPATPCPHTLTPSHPTHPTPPPPFTRLLLLWRPPAGRRCGRGLWPALLAHAQPPHCL